MYLEGKQAFKQGFQDIILANIEDHKEVTAVGYVLFHGGVEIEQEVTKVSERTMLAVEKACKYLPEENNITLRALKYFRKKFPYVPHFLFSDTAYFASLPKTASTYAVPNDLTMSGIKRYGGFGLCHSWAYEQAKKLIPGGEQLKAVSIYVGNRTNVAAVKNGKPEETSIGFTNLEGIPTMRSCGDIDPTIVFQLMAEGLSFEDINGLLTDKSGFSGLTDKNIEIKHIIDDSLGAELSEARDIYYYSIIKQIGSSMSVMGGADTLIVTSENDDLADMFISSLCRKLKFPKLKKRSGAIGVSTAKNMTGEGSELNIVYIKYDLWKIMSDKIKV
jgi:acetate kinase